MKYILILLLSLFSCKEQEVKKKGRLKETTEQVNVEKITDSKKEVKDSRSVLLTNKFSQISLECNENEFPSICESSFPYLKLNFDFDNDPNIVTFFKDDFKKSIQMPVFFEGLDYKPLLFRSDDDDTIIFFMLNLIYEYKSIYYCYSYSENNLHSIGKFDQQAILDEDDKEIQYNYGVEYRENSFFVRIGDGKKDVIHNLHN